MSLVWAALTPHSPLLIPKIGKDNLAKLKETQNSFAELAESLAKSKADSIIVLSPHGIEIDGAFALNMGVVENNENIYWADFEEFGDFESKYRWEPDIYLSYKIKSYLETRSPLQLATSEKLDHGASVPLILLAKNLPEAKVIVINTSNLSREEHITLGTYLKEIIMTQEKNIAVIASGDLSHRLDENSPMESNSAGPEFDEFIREKLDQADFDAILNIDETLVQEAGECAYKSLLIMLGLVKEYNWSFKELSYEKPFGIGYLSGEFKLN